MILSLLLALYRMTEVYTVAFKSVYAQFWKEMLFEWQFEWQFNKKKTY